MALSNFISKCFGLVAGVKFPKFIQSRINEAYVRHFDIDMSEFNEAKDYESLNALFTRKLCLARSLDEGFISPSDGKILQCGSSFKAENEKFAFSIKGFTYSINELLRGVESSKNLQDLLYINIYLSPKDYHRHHAPCDMQILSATYTSGVLLSVSEKTLKKYAKVYTQNERVVLECKVGTKLLYLVFVGALNVGKMRFVFDENLQTNALKARDFTHTYENLLVKKGEELGNFELGSTIVIIAQKELLELECENNANVKFGTKIANLRG